MNEINSEQAQTSWRPDRLERLGQLERQKKGVIEAALVCLVAAAKRAGGKTHV